jgi:Phage phiEco32-like COOH.NH2 ligase-type 2
MIEGSLSKKRVLSLGADPELFCFSGIKLLPAWEFLPAKGEYNMMYWDGAQAEWKYNHEGNHCQNNLVLHTRENLMRLDKKVKEYNRNGRLTLQNVVRVPQAILDNADGRYIELGCMPSYNAYKMRGKQVENPRLLPYRFAGGHMHFGTFYPQRPNYEKIVKTLDNILGVWAVGVARDLDNPIRRQYYGLAGEFRRPRYKNGFGVEYRVLSNFWLAAPKIMQVTWDIGRLCVRLTGSKYAKLWASNQDETIDVINNCDVKRANKIIERNEPMFKWMLKQAYGKNESVERALNLSYLGLGHEVGDPEDFRSNWAFDKAWIPNAGAPWARFEV